MDALNYLRGRRLWHVPDFLVWGLADEALFYYLGVERVDSNDRVMFGMSGVGDSAQDVMFSDLVDFRGNNLPDTIASPRVLVRFRSEYSAYVIGEESGAGFRVARDPFAPGPVRVDLFVYEMDG